MLVRIALGRDARRPGPLGRLGDEAEVAADDDVGAVGERDVAADAERVQVAADVDPGAGPLRLALVERRRAC